MFNNNESEEGKCKGTIINKIYDPTPNIWGQRNVMKCEYEYFVDGIRYVSLDSIFDMNNNYDINQHLC